MSDIICINDLCKSFGSKKVIDSLTFTVPSGSVFGFIGKNGEGKTTIMRMILGLLKIDSGNITVCGETVQYGQTKTNRNIGYLPDVPEFYNYMRPREYLKLCGQITNLSDKEIKMRTDEMLQLVGLSGENKKIGGFSRGMKQRLGIAQALLNSPKVLICDEPTSALDPIGRKDILDILLRVRGDTTVLFSTHILSDVERICDNIAVLNGGKIALSGTLDEIKATSGNDKLEIEFANETDLQIFLNAPPIQQYKTTAICDGATVYITNNDMAKVQSCVIEALYKEKISPVKLELAEPMLENLFMEAVG